MYIRIFVLCLLSESHFQPVGFRLKRHLNFHFDFDCQEPILTLLGHFIVIQYIYPCAKS